MKKVFIALGEIAQTLARTYATVIFTNRAGLGGLLCLITFLFPWQGLVGLTGTCVALLTARLAGFDRPAIADGRLLFNPLLASLALGYWSPPLAAAFPLFVALLILVSLAALGCTLFFNHLTFLAVGTGSRSLPYCVVAIGLYWLLAREISFPTESHTQAALFALPLNLPAPVELWGRALGAAFFMPVASAGLLITLVLFFASRLSLLHALVGYGVAALLLQGVNYPFADSFWLYLNAMMCAVALGGIFFVPSRASLALAILGAALATVADLALAQGLRWLDVPVLTLPFNAVVLALAGALRWRVAGKEPRAVLFAGSSPEATFQADRLWTARNPESDLPAVALPFDGTWVVTQSFDDKLTHRGDWRHALDFEVAPSGGRAIRPASGFLEDFPSYGAPVIAPADGRIVRLVDHIADNPVGGNNLVENWGNSLVLEISPALFVQLSHFRPRSFKVREGDRVRRGQLLGYLGNSGRSPVPHLHLQMQSCPEIGSPTIPFRLREFRTPAAPGLWRYPFRGLPAESQIVAGSRRARWMEECFTLEGSRERTYRRFTARGEERETIQFQSQPDGSLLLQSRGKKTRVRLILAEGHLTPVEFHGSRSSVLAVLGGSGRIPLITSPGLQWQDAINPSFGANWFRRGLSDFFAPWFGSAWPPAQGEMIACSVSDEQFAVRWTSPDRFIAEINFSAEHILGSGRLETTHGWMRFLAVDDHVAPEPSVLAPTPALAHDYALL